MLARIVAGDVEVDCIERSPYGDAARSEIEPNPHGGPGERGPNRSPVGADVHERYGLVAAEVTGRDEIGMGSLVKGGVEVARRQRMPLGEPTLVGRAQVGRPRRADPKRRGLLFAGTEQAVYVSLDDGESWQSLRLNMPATSIRDLVVKDDDLVIGTHGRSFWILDDITPLRQVDRGGHERAGSPATSPARTRGASGGT